jgi:ankyrin repeat protein
MQAAADGKSEELQRMIREAEERGELEQLILTRDRNGSTPEHWAAGGGHLECLEILLEKRDTLPKVNSAIPSEEVQKKKLRRRDGKTCMHYAARNGQLECIRYLVEQRGDPIDARSGDGTTPLHMACFGASPAVVQYLVKHGADLHAVNEWSCSAAHWVAMSQSKDCEAMSSLCQLLLKAGIPFDAAQKQGHSALHKASQKQNGHVIEWMAKPSAEGGAGLTKAERQHASRPDNGGHRPSDIWSSVGGDAAFTAWIKEHFES